MAEEVSMTVDNAGYEAALAVEQDKNAAALAAKKGVASEKDMTFEAEQTSALTTKGVEPTNAAAKYVWHHEPTARVEAIYAGRAMGFVESASAADGEVAVVLDATSFYAESGGQARDARRARCSFPFVRSFSFRARPDGWRRRYRGPSVCELKITVCLRDGGRPPDLRHGRADGRVERLGEQLHVPRRVDADLRRLRVALRRRRGRQLRRLGR